MEALRCTWGEAYEVGVDGGLWWFRRKDGIGGIETATSPDGLLAQIVTDHDVLPVRCPPLPYGSLTATGYQPSGPLVDGTAPDPSPTLLRAV